ncbi:TRAP transporter substrate-binding protein [Litoribacter populi]|uniref:TRAP transporter substrate-binding protein n=1 Tax=Litoribacter populi TaxID=2598460 RepID=UPI00117DB61F|nr:TRAP transporter substrate-binding protein [Litoribacter populi]
MNQRFLLFFLLILICGCRQKDAVRVIKMGHGLGTSHPVHEAMVFLAERVEKKSAGQMQVKIYPNQQLGTERELMELLQIGSLGMTKVSIAVMESFAPKLEMLSLPYLFRDDEHRHNILFGEIGKRLLLEGEDYWLRGLTFYDAGNRSFYTKNGPVESPDNLRGKKIRVMESNLASSMVKNFGGSPTPVSYGELYTALQQGVVDGAENNPPSLFTSRHYEVCKYYSINEHVATPDIVLVSTKIWNRLSPEEQNWLQEAAEESAVYQRKIWAEATSHALKEMEKSGVTITYPDQEPFRSAVEPIYHSLENFQPQLFDLIQEIRNHP